MKQTFMTRRDYSAAQFHPKIPVTLRTANRPIRNAVAYAAALEVLG